MVDDDKNIKKRQAEAIMASMLQSSAADAPHSASRTASGSLTGVEWWLLLGGVVIGIGVGAGFGISAPRAASAASVLLLAFFGACAGMVAGWLLILLLRIAKLGRGGLD